MNDTLKAIYKNKYKWEERSQKEYDTMWLDKVDKYLNIHYQRSVWDGRRWIKWGGYDKGYIRR